MKVLIAGYYGFDNVGDELILSQLKTQLENKYIDVSLTVLSADPEQTESLHGVRSKNRWNPLAVLVSLFRTNLFVLGGGGLIQNKTSKGSLFYYLSLVFAAVLLRVSTVIYAVGVEEVHGAFSIWLIRHLFSNRLVTLSVRDEESERALKNFGLSKNIIHLTADPVFSMNIQKPGFDRWTMRTYGSKSSLMDKKVLFIPRYPVPPGESLLYCHLVQTFRQHGADLKVCLFQPRVELKLLRDSSLPVVISESDFVEYPSALEVHHLLKEFDIVVSARFHGLVLAGLLDLPSMGVGDEVKVGRLCRELALPFIPWGEPLSAIQPVVARFLSLRPQASSNPLHQSIGLAQSTIERIPLVK